MDQLSQKPIPFAEVYFSNLENSIKTDLQGELKFSAEEYPIQIRIEALGFKTVTKQVTPATEEIWVGMEVKTESLSQVVIQSAIIPKQIQHIPTAVNILNSKEINRAPNFVITEILNRAPGVMVQNGALNTQKIVIRGVGSRAQYGTNRVKAYFDDIPLSTADGATTIEDLDPDAIGRVEIIKGPTSSVYGAGLGGVMNFYSAEAENNATTTRIKYLFGSFGLNKKTLSASHSEDANKFFATYNHLANDGYRNNSEYDRKNLLLNGKIFTRKGNNFSVLANYTKLKAFIPSSINRETFNEDPKSAAFTWAATKGYEAYEKITLGTAYRHRFSENFTNNTSIFLNSKTADEPRPFDILKEERSAAGARTKFNYTGKLADFPTELSFGAEYLREWYSMSTFENLYEDFPDQGSVAGEILSNNKQQRQYINGFGQVNFSFSKKWNFEAGFNINSTNYELEDLFNQDEVDQSGAYTFKTILSPRIGATYDIAEGKTLYASISHGFSTPNVQETLTPEGLINTGLQAETGMNYELGIKTNWLQNKLYAELAVYSIQINNLLVAQRVAEDQYVGINAGKTDHTGVEILLDYKMKITPYINLRPYAAASFNFYKFDVFMDEEDDFSGNELTGVPDRTLNLGLDLSTDFGLSVFGTYNHVGEIPLNDENSLYTDSYNVLNIKVIQELELLRNIKAQFIGGVNNVLDEHYAASIVTNAIGFGGSAPRYFYPGDPRNYYVGMSLNYFF